MTILLDALERHRELVPGKGRYSAFGARRAGGDECGDRLVPAPARAKDLLRGISATKPSPLLFLDHGPEGRRRGRGDARVRGRQPSRTAGPTLKGEFCWTVNLTDAPMAQTCSVRNNAHLNVLAALQHAKVETIPFTVTGAKDNTAIAATTNPTRLDKAITDAIIANKIDFKSKSMTQRL